MPSKESSSQIVSTEDPNAHTKFNFKVEEPQEEEDEKDKDTDGIQIQSPPTLQEGTLTTENIDYYKFQGYQYLNDMYRKLHEIQELPDPEARLKKQTTYEDYSLELLDTLRNRLKINNIECVDHTRSFITNASARTIERQVSTTTALYTTGRIGQTPCLLYTSPSPRD